MKNKILKTEDVKWKKMTWLQNKTLKELTKENFERLKNSLKENDFIQPFNVWQDKDTTYILDGHHRKEALEALMQEGEDIPELLTANFIECKDIRHAAKLVPVYSSLYAKITDEGLYEFMHTFDLDFEELKLQTDIPSINLDKFELSYLKDEDEEKEIKKKICPHCGCEI